MSSVKMNSLLYVLYNAIKNVILRRKYKVNCNHKNSLSFFLSYMPIQMTVMRCRSQLNEYKWNETNNQLSLAGLLDREHVLSILTAGTSI